MFKKHNLNDISYEEAVNILLENSNSFRRMLGSDFSQPQEKQDLEDLCLEIYILARLFQKPKSYKPFESLRGDR